MTNKLLIGVAATAILGGLTATAQAASVSFMPNATTVSVGDTVTFTYSMDFSDEGTFGGGTDIFYDNSILQFLGWTFGPTGDPGSGDSFYHTAPTDCTVANSDAGCGFDADEFGAGLAQLNNLAWGDDGGMFGPGVIGQAMFSVVGVGTAQMFMAANDDGQAGNNGPFVSTDTFMQHQNVSYNGGSVTAVPLPAAAWLMLGGLGVLGRIRRQA